MEMMIDRILIFVQIITEKTCGNNLQTKYEVDLSHRKLTFQARLA